MTLNLGLRRIASLSAFLLAMGIASASQAGIIPWTYDAVFGPVRHPAYGYGGSPYAVSYSRPVYVRSAPMYAPVSYGNSSGCSTCSTSYYAPVSYASPSYGCGCGPVVAAPSCGPCGGVSQASTSGSLSGCGVPATSAPTPAKAPATNGKSAWKKPADPTNDPTLTPRTFKSPDRGASPAGATSTDGFVPSRGKQVDEAVGNSIEANRPAPTEEELIIVKPKKAPAKPVVEDLDLDHQTEPAPAKPAEKDEFQLPKDSNKPAGDATEFKTDSTTRLLKPNLDAKITWRAEPLPTRVPLHAKLAKASVTRRAPGLDSDWTPVVAKPVGTQLVRK